MYLSASDHSVPLNRRFISSCEVARGARKCFLKSPPISSNLSNGLVIISVIKIVKTVGNKVPSPSEMKRVKGVIAAIIIAVLA